MNTWYLYFTFDRCGSGSAVYPAYRLNNNNIALPIGTIQIPCSVLDKEAYVREYMITFLGITSSDIIYSNGILYYEPTPGQIPTINNEFSVIKIGFATIVAVFVGIYLFKKRRK